MTPQHITPNGNNDNDVTPNGDKMDITPNGDDNDDTPNGDDMENVKNVKDIFNESRLKHNEFLKGLHEEIYDDKTDDDIHCDYRSDIYGLVISFMGRHDRWLHCRLVCKLWNDLVYNKYWIFTEHITME